ncbi:MAG: CHASE2 domain-containing protein [Nitrospirota bacterium]
MTEHALFGKSPFNHLTGGARKHRAATVIGMVITASMTILMLLNPPPLELLEDKLLDYRFRIRGTPPHSDNVVIAAIDEKSITKLGRWPWSRDKIALLVQQLNKLGAEVIVFDAFFSEREENDPLLGKAINDAGNVLLSIVFDFHAASPASENEYLLAAAFPSIDNPEKFKLYAPISLTNVLLPTPDLIKEAMLLGHINMFPDRDGTVRWETLVIEHNGYLYPSITLQAAAAYLGVPREKITLKATEGVQLGKRFIPTDVWGRMLINFYGPWNTFRHIPIADIIEGSANPELLRGKVVLIGATAVGIYDLRITPFSAAMPGVEKHASVITSIIENKFLQRVPRSADMIILLITGTMLSLLLPRYRAAGASGITLLFLILTLGTNYYLFAQRGFWANIGYPSLTTVLIFIVVMAYSYAVEEKNASRIRAMFSSYVTERVVNELIKNPDMAKLGGERREVTVIFSDVRGFTSFSEKHSPEEVVAILNEYLSAMTDIVFKWEGTLDKFIGDAILAFWGAPMKQENHAELAVRCALHMVKRLEELQQKWRAEGKPVLDCGIGINSGVVIVGNIGAEGKKMDYTVIGDHVNLGSRVEALTRKYSTRILITGFTLEKIRNLIESRKIANISVKGLERVVVKGKESPVEIYELASLRHGEKSIITQCDTACVVEHREK